MTIKEWAEKIHENAVNHGFWENEKSFAEIVALCHSEISEALEADRAGEPLFWTGKDGKPEGVATEMADCVIRILDWFGAKGIDPEKVIAEKHDYNTKRPYRHGKKY